MNFLISVSSCNDSGMRSIMLFIKNTLTLIQIIVPILLIVMGSINLVKIVKNPDDKKGLSRVKNSFIAAIIVFFIPVFLNVLMYAIGENTTISDCWNNASDTSTSTGYMDPNDNGRPKNQVYTNPGDYQ